MYCKLIETLIAPASASHLTFWQIPSDKVAFRRKNPGSLGFSVIRTRIARIARIFTEKT